MNLIKIIMVLLVFLLVVNSVDAVGVAPAVNEVVAGEEQSISMRIFNEDQSEKTVVLELSGELKDYLVLSSNEINFRKGQRHQEIVLIIKEIPVNNFQPGTYVNRVLLKKKSEVERTNLARVGVSSRINIVVPGEAPNLQGNLFAPNFEKDKHNLLSLEINNVGNTRANDCVSVVTIYSVLNEVVDNFASKSFDVDPTSQKRVSMSWTPNVHPGNYLANAQVSCENADANFNRTFSVGSPHLAIGRIYSDDFRLGRVSLLNLIVSSSWGSSIRNVFVELDLEKEGEIVTQYTSASKDFNPRQSRIFDVYLNTEDLLVGEYDLFVRLNYLDQEIETKYLAILERDEIIVQPITGMVVQQSLGERDVSVSLLVLAVFALVIVNIFLLYYLVFKKRKG